MTIKFVDELPGGRQVLPLERDGELRWLVLRGAMTEEARDEFAVCFRYLTENRHWVQQWKGRGIPPQSRRAA
ncbi:hypothetical protein [Streptomyces sp. NPDC059008]|uniref:hypothetical protein n=1 Tax=Streptomyces sp. NPDC059008 TaxID=3346693 RepID=UPI0036AED51A